QRAPLDSATTRREFRDRLLGRRGDFLLEPRLQIANSCFELADPLAHDLNDGRGLSSGRVLVAVFLANWPRCRHGHHIASSAEFVNTSSRPVAIRAGPYRGVRFHDYAFELRIRLAGDTRSCILFFRWLKTRRKGRLCLGLSCKLSAFSSATVVA